MRKPALITYYGRLGDANLSQTTANVVNSLTGNAKFLQLQNIVAELQSELEAFHESMERAANGDRRFIAEKNQLREKLRNSMQHLAKAVNAHAHGDNVMLVSSGFTLAAERGSAPPITTPEDFEISDGLNPGELKFSVRKVPGARCYIFEYTEDNPTENANWILEPNTSRTCLLTAFRSGARIYGRVTAIGTKGQEAVSVVRSRIVQ